jgi:hypothetical protein
MTYTLESVHEGYINHSSKKIGLMKNYIWQFPFKDIEEVLHKANRYSTLGVSKLQEKNKKGGIFVLSGIEWKSIKK